MPDWNYLMSFAISSLITVFIIISALVLFLTFLNRSFAKLNKKMRRQKK